jgi:hypothetical protein
MVAADRGDERDSFTGANIRGPVPGQHDGGYLSEFFRSDGSGEHT